jgi:hypothetical protein
VEDGGAACGATPNDDVDCVAGGPNGEGTDRETVCFATPKDDVLCVNGRPKGEGEAGGALEPKVLVDGGSPNVGCAREFDFVIPPPKEEGEVCGLDTPKEAEMFESSPGVLPNAEEIEDEGIGAPMTGADTEGLAIEAIESRGLETLYFLANLVNISASRP